MKPIKLLSAIGLILITLVSCTSTRSVQLSLMRPADIHLDSRIERILLVDRTEPQQKTLGIIEGILTGEAPYEDRAAVQQIISSIRNEVQTSPRFTVNSASGRIKGNSFSSAFPSQLTWPTINSLCRQYDAQVVVSIEIFDTDFIITEGKRRVKKTVGSGDKKREIEVDEYYAEGVGNVKIGIRLYDNINQTIVDEQLLNQTNTWRAAADSKAGAVAALISKSEATQELGRRVGRNYALKIAPLPIQVVRTYYRKSKKAPVLEKGTRLAEVGQWNEAMSTWKTGISIADKKRAGQLCYNVAVGYEVLGDLDLAIEWAQKAYTQYGNKLGRNYVGILNDRKIAEARLKEQMK